MTFKMFWLAIAGLFVGTSLCAQELTGDWQGTLQMGSQPLRLIVKFKRADTGEWAGTFYSIDQGSDWGAGATIISITLQGPQLKFALGGMGGTYEGRFTGNASIEGTWTQRGSAPLVLRRVTPDTAWKDPAPHTIQFVTVDKNVKLEVLAFGGSGRPLVFLAGMGNTAHVFDKFAARFTPAHLVYAITRRGFGDSSVPADGYTADRLGDDVLAVLDALKLTRPVLAGHSVAGQELSSIASRHPDRVAGLVYLDAAYTYAFYNSDRGDVVLDSMELGRKLELLVNGPIDSRPTIKELLEDLPRFEKNLQARQMELDAMPPAMLAAPLPAVPRAIMAGARKYTRLSGVPILAIYALPHEFPGPATDPARASRETQDQETTGIQAAAFEKGVPSARVVRLPHANHYVFRSNEAEVLREMNVFLAGLK
jgi:non-heme chloroperoxidase